MLCLGPPRVNITAKLRRGRRGDARILVGNAHRKGRVKRGGHLRPVDLEGDALEAPRRDERLLALDEALGHFAAIEPTKAELLKLHAFGLSLAASAEVMGISPTTADR
jgi:hypothetical protein